MSKKERTYSIIVVSDALSTNKEFSVSSRLIRNSIIAISILLILFGVVIFDYLTTALDREKLYRLESENREKENMIAQLNSQVDDLSRSLQNMKEITEKILVVSGLKSPFALKEVGRGGGPIQNFNLSTPEVNVEKSQDLKNGMLERATDLNSKFKKLENTLKFVSNVIDQQKLRLSSTPSIWPTHGYITDGFGWRRHPFTGKRDYHHGVDIATQLGNKIIAPASGTILVAERRGYYGNLVIIDHGFGYTTWFGHLAAFNVKEGDRVKREQVIGFVGSTGRSLAPHLHYEVRVFGKPQNPINYIID